MAENEIQKDDIFFLCDRCAGRFAYEEIIEEDGLYCKPCYTKLIERGDI